MNEPWETFLLAWLHDPADKAADIRRHISRAMRYAASVLDREVTQSELEGALADQLASAYQRLLCQTHGTITKNAPSDQMKVGLRSFIQVAQNGGRLRSA